LTFEGRLEWNFREKSITVSVREASGERGKIMQDAVKASFGITKTGKEDIHWRDYYRKFTKNRGDQHDKIKGIVDVIFNAYYI
jgi:hypothetical protein